MKQYPPQVQAEIRSILTAAVGIPDGRTALWIDGTPGSLELARIARVPAYCQYADECPEEAFEGALEGIYILSPVKIAGTNPILLAEVDDIIGPADQRTRIHAYHAYLMAIRIADDGYETMISPTGAEAVLCTSFRIAAAFDGFEADYPFDLRKALWGITDPIKRYERLVGASVARRRTEDVLDAIQRYERDVIAMSDAFHEGLVASKLRVSVELPFLDEALSRYVSSLPASVRFQREATPDWL